MIKALIFDLGGVILIHDKDLMGNILSEMFSISLSSAINLWNENKLDLLNGTITSKQFIQKLTKTVPVDNSFMDLYCKWEELYAKNSQIDKKMIWLINEFRKKYKIFLLTDTIDTHHAYNGSRNIYSIFDRVFASHIEKITKAEGKKVFEYVIDKINLKPNECIFIDDLEEYVKCAQQIGIYGIQYTKISELKRDLHRIILSNT
jgi:glucose-1-phosphatase